MNLPDPTDREWNEYVGQALMAQFALLPKPMRPDLDLIPGRDDLEECEATRPEWLEIPAFLRRDSQA